VNPTGNPNSEDFVFNSTLDSESPLPDILAVSYSKREISAYCKDGLCAFGNYSVASYLSFELYDSRIGATIRMRAVDKEWEFPDDAPSVVLSTQLSDDQLGSVVLQSAVTERNHCRTLKVCLSSRTPSFDTIAPLGVLLMAQNRYAEYCSRPRIYSIS